MKVLNRLNEALQKFIFCYTATKDFSSFLSLMWFTKLYRLRKKSAKFKNRPNDHFSISLAAFPGRPIYLRTYAGDVDIFYEIFYKEIYQLPELVDKSIIVDAGANVGFAALYFLKQMPNATIYCIEPDPDNFLFLQKNLKAALESGKVKALLAGLSDKDGFMNLEKNVLKYNSSLVENASENSVEVITYSVKSFLKKFVEGNIDLFKMDIEGTEENIFENDISWLVKVEQLLIEFHSEEIKKMCFEKLQAQNFYFKPQISKKNTDVFLFSKNEKKCQNES
ncbi:MAG TPA: FkbM family methyltransferase [Hanamia sp.]